MATRSRIGVMLDDGSVKQVYCHFDGYVEGVGLTLVENYDTLEKAKTLISFGDMSYLRPEISTAEPHSFEKPVDGVTVFYGRDRGESGTQPYILSMDEWLGEFSTCEDYLYLFTGGQWWVYDRYEKDGWRNVKSFFPQYVLTGEELACNI
jgi:hypothetical protein